jgi:hypothetical protein
LSLEERASRALTELRKLLHAAGHEAGVSPDAEFPFQSVELALTLDLRRAHSSRDDAAAIAALVQQARARVDDGVRAMSAFSPGRVYCFLCDASDCAHAKPGAADAIFSGYNATGKPQWASFANACLARAEPRVDRLYADPPEVIAIVDQGERLSGDLLAAFGRDSRSFRVLGQVSAGLVSEDLGAYPRAAGRERKAFSFQVVETRSEREPWCLRANLIGLDLSALGAVAGEAGERSVAEALRRTLREADAAVAALARRSKAARLRGGSAMAPELVDSLLAQLRGDIERVFRANARRTSHAHHRHQAGERPTGSAMGDARAIGQERLYRDTRRGTLVVLGPKGRVHVFADDAKHVTSLVLERTEVERRLADGRWRPVQPPEFLDFQAALARSLETGPKPD